MVRDLPRKLYVYLRLPEAVEDYSEDDYDKVGHRSPRLLINPDPDGV